MTAVKSVGNARCVGIRRSSLPPPEVYFLERRARQPDPGEEQS